MASFVYRLRSSLLEVFCKKGVLRNFAKFIAKHLCQSLFFNKVAGLRPAPLLKKSFVMYLAKFLRKPFLTEHLRWLLVWVKSWNIVFFKWFSIISEPQLCEGEDNKSQKRMLKKKHWFLVRISRVWTEYEDLLRKSPYSVRIRKNTGQKILRIWTLLTHW